MLSNLIKPLIKGALAGAVIMFVWINISWAVLPFHAKTMTVLPPDSSVVESLSKGNFERDVLIAPQWEDDPELKKDALFIINVPSNQRQSMTDMMIMEFVLDFFAAGILTLLVIMTVGSRSCFCQYSFCTLAGIMVGISAYLPNVGWWGMPWDFAITGMMDCIISFMLAGIAIVQIVRRCYTPPELATVETNTDSQATDSK